MDTIPELSKKGPNQNFLKPFLRTQNSFNFKSSGIIHFGEVQVFNVHTPNKTRSSAFHWNNSRTSKIEGILSSEKRCESSGFQISLNSGIISVQSVPKFFFWLLAQWTMKSREMSSCTVAESEVF